MLSSTMVGFLADGSCPLCGVSVLAAPADVPADEVEAAPGRALAPFLPRPATVDFGPDGMPQCLRCGGIWPLTRSQEQLLLDSLDDEADSRPAVDLRETGHAEDVVKVERRRCDNRDSPASMTRTLTVSHTIERSAVVETSRAFAVGGGASGKLLGAGVEARIEASIARKYSVGDRETIIVSDTLSVSVPPGVAVDVVVRWTRVWQEGEARLATGPSGNEVVVPYRLPAALRLDTQTVEV